MTRHRSALRRIGLILGALLLVLGITYLALRLSNPGVETHPYFAQERVMVIAHRGGVNLWPENTVYAFERALELGVDVLEMDVRGTADDRLVLLHDETVDRTTDGEGRIRNLTLAQVRELDAGYNWPDGIVTRSREEAGDAWQEPRGQAAPPADRGEHPYRGMGIRIPTLEEVLTTFPDARMNIELKETDPELIARFVEIMRQADRGERTLLASFYPETIEALRRELPDYATSGVEPEIRPFVIMSKIGLGELHRPPAQAYQVPEYAGSLQVITPGMTRSAARLGLHVDAWSAGSWDGPVVFTEDMQRLIDHGVDGIITDRPDLLLELLDRR